MDFASVLQLAKQALTLVLVLSAPVVGALAITGLFVGVLQAVTSIQDATLPLAVKIIVGLLALVWSAPWIGSELMAYADRIFELISMPGN